MEQAIALLQSGKSSKQLSALNKICEYLKSSLPTIELISVLCEDGISSDNHHVRTMAFKCIKCIYKRRVSRWEDIRQAIISELNDCEELDPLVAAVELFRELPDREFTVFVMSSDVMAALKSSCTTNDMKAHVRTFAIESTGHILLRAWKLVESKLNVEGCSSYESTTEAKRAVEDFRDFVIDIFKGFALGILGKAPGLDPNKGYLEDMFTTLNSYSHVINHLVSLYNNRKVMVCNWTSALLGITSKPDIGGYSFVEDIELLSLLPLVQSVLAILLEDPYLLFTRWKQFASSGDLFRLITGVLLILLFDMKIPNSSLVGIDFLKSSQYLFASDTGNLSTLNSRKGPRLLTPVKLSEEWLLSHALSTLSSTSTNVDQIFLVDACRLCLCMLDDDRLTFVRFQICPVIVEAILRILRRKEIVINYAYYDLIALGLYCIRYICSNSAAINCGAMHSENSNQISSTSTSTLLAVTVGSYLSAFCECINRLSTDEDVVTTRLLAEVACIAVLDPNTVARAAPTGQWLKSLLDGQVVSTALVDTAAESTLRQRLLTAIARILQKLLPLETAHLVHTTIAEQNLLAVESFTQNLGNLVRLILQTLRMFKRCLNWPIENFHGEACQMQYVSLLSATACMFCSNNILQLGLTASKQLRTLATEYCSFLDEFLSFQLSEHVYSYSAKLQFIIFLAQWSSRLSNCDPHFTFSKASQLVLDFISQELLLAAHIKRAASTHHLDMWRNCEGAISTKSIAHEKHFKYRDDYAAYQMNALHVADLIISFHPELTVPVYQILTEYDRSLSTAAANMNPDGLSPDFFPPIVRERVVVLRRRLISNMTDQAFYLSVTSKGAAITSSQSQILKPQLARQKHQTDDGIFALNVFDESYCGSNFETEHQSLVVLQSERRQTGTGTPVLPSSLPANFFIESTPCCSDATDSGSECGAFSMMSTECRNGYVLSKRVCCADTYALIDDVMIPHMTNDPSIHSTIQTDGQSSGSNNLCNFLSDDGIQWRVLSGSSDPVVITAYSSCDPKSMTVNVNVRVINSSGIRIPPFAIQVSVLMPQHSCLSDQRLDGDTGTGIGVALLPNQPYTVECKDYLLPSAFVERDFVFSVISFAGADFSVRIIYSDLIRDGINDDIFSRLATQAEASGFEGNYEDPLNNQDQDQHNCAKWAAVTQSIPLHLPIFSQMMPYGAGSLSAMSSFFKGSIKTRQPQPGIPSSVFRALWSRLLVSDSVAVGASIPSRLAFEGNEKQFSGNGEGGSVISEVASCLSTLLTRLIGSFDIDSSSRVDLGQEAEEAHRGNSNLWSDSISSVLAWAFQTWWGGEVAIRVSIAKIGKYRAGLKPLTPLFRERDKISYWKGRMEIKASSEVIVRRLLAHCDLFLNALTAGVIYPIDADDNLLNEFSVPAEIDLFGRSSIRLSSHITRGELAYCIGEAEKSIQLESEVLFSGRLAI